MELLKWRPAFSLGIPSVDLEHREMIAMINQVYQQIENVSDHQAIEHFLAEIHANISAHFALEERLMKNIVYSLSLRF